MSGGRVYVTAPRAGTLQQFDAASGDPVGEPLAVGRQPDNPAVVGDVVWVALSGDDAIARIEGDQIKKIPVGDAPEDIAIAGDSIWVANAGDGTVSRIDRAARRVIGEPIPVGPKPLGIAANGTRCGSPATRTTPCGCSTPAPEQVRGKPIAVGSQPRAVAVGGGSAWVANAGDDTVTRVRDRLEIPVGANPRDLAVAGGSVWVGNAADDTRLPHRRRVRRRRRRPDRGRRRPDRDRGGRRSGLGLELPRGHALPDSHRLTYPFRDVVQHHGAPGAPARPRAAARRRRGHGLLGGRRVPALPRPPRRRGALGEDGHGHRGERPRGQARAHARRLVRRRADRLRGLLRDARAAVRARARRVGGRLSAGPGQALPGGPVGDRAGPRELFRGLPARLAGHLSRPPRGARHASG